MKRCVIYARVACRQQVISKQNVLTEQVEELKKFAKKMKYKVDQVFREYGSGTDQDRPALNQLLQEVKHGQVKNILCRDFTRLTRSFCDWVEIDQLFKAKGVKIIIL